jgi:hypothetical protein
MYFVIYFDVRRGDYPASAIYPDTLYHAPSLPGKITLAGGICAASRMTKKGEIRRSGEKPAVITTGRRSL